MFYKKLLCFIGSTISISHRAPSNFEIESIDVLFEPFLVLFARYFLFYFCLLFFFFVVAGVAVALIRGMPHTFTHTAHTILYLSFDTLANIYFTTLTALSCLFEAAVVSLVLECLRCYLHFCANFLQFRFGFCFCLSAYFILVSLLASVLLLFAAVFLPYIFLLSTKIHISMK